VVLRTYRNYSDFNLINVIVISLCHS